MPALTNTLPRTGALLLAAGKGTRMHSELPKVLLPLLETPMLAYVLQAAHAVCGTNTWTVIGHRADMIEKAFPEERERCIVQQQQLGTGHALQTAWPALCAAGLTHVLVINADTPLINAHSIREFAHTSLALGADISFMTLTLANPGSFGRVVRNGEHVQAIIEAKDYNPDLHGHTPHEINAGIYCLCLASIGPLLDKLTAANKSGEYYITDLVGLAVEAGLAVAGICQGNDTNLLGVNSPQELVAAEERLREAIVNTHLANNVFIRQPHSVRLGPNVVLEQGASVTGPCEIYGESVISHGAVIESHCFINNTHVGQGAVVRSFCHMENAELGPAVTIGPFARLRPGAVLEQDVHVGNFVEVKKSRLHKGAKAGHLSYLGDCEVGEGANIGAGTITCNYDGKNKHTTVIGRGAFIGSNTALVAPVTVGENALVGAGSVITRNVPDNTLAVARGKQVTLPRKK